MFPRRQCGTKANDERRLEEGEVENVRLKWPLADAERLLRTFCRTSRQHREFVRHPARYVLLSVSVTASLADVEEGYSKPTEVQIPEL